MQAPIYALTLSVSLFFISTKIEASPNLSDDDVLTYLSELFNEQEDTETQNTRLKRRKKNNTKARPPCRRILSITNLEETDTPVQRRISQPNLSPRSPLQTPRQNTLENFLEGHRHRTFRILIADDYAFNLLVLRSTIETFAKKYKIQHYYDIHFEITEVHDGEEALHALMHQNPEAPFDFAILDRDMSRQERDANGNLVRIGMDGDRATEIWRSIEAESQRPSLLIAALSANETEEDIIETCLKRGMNAFFKKGTPILDIMLYMFSELLSTNSEFSGHQEETFPNPLALEDDESDSSTRKRELLKHLHLQ